MTKNQPKLNKTIEKALARQKQSLLKKIEREEKSVTEISKAYTSNDFEKELFENGCYETLDIIKDIIERL